MDAHSPMPKAHVLVVMGVSGSGKSTVGALLAGRLHCDYADADDFHSEANIEKMHNGKPLTDADRAPWLDAIAEQIDEWRARGVQAVVTCSALKRRYRDVIIGERDDVRLVYLKGEKDVIARRLQVRHGHFMQPGLLQSQLDTLEEPTPDEHAITISISKRPPALVDEIVTALEVAEADGSDS
jgi:gluconokinase